MPFKTSFFDKINRIKQTINQIEDLQIGAGFFADKNEKNKDGVSVVDRAVRNNYGIGCPARPFATVTKAENERKHARNSAKAIISGIIHTDAAMAVQGLNAEAKEYGAEMKKAIKDWTIPHNSPVTIKKKGFDDPLIETGQMMEKTEGRVFKKK